jgi:hypothetical protein
MRREDDDKLWDLLGRAAEPNISPFFARNVLRKIRAAQGEPKVVRWFSLRWLIPASGVAVVIIALSLGQMPERRRPDSPAEKIAVTEAQDSELIADLDDLIAADDSNSWDDSVFL